MGLIQCDPLPVPMPVYEDNPVPMYYPDVTEPSYPPNVVCRWQFTGVQGRVGTHLIKSLIYLYL